MSYEEVYKRRDGAAVSYTLSREELIERLITATQDLRLAANPETRPSYATLKDTIGRAVTAGERLREFDADEGWTRVTDEDGLETARKLDQHQRYITDRTRRVNPKDLARTEPIDTEAPPRKTAPGERYKSVRTGTTYEVHDLETGQCAHQFLYAKGARERAKELNDRDREEARA